MLVSSATKNSCVILHTFYKVQSPRVVDGGHEEICHDTMIRIILPAKHFIIEASCGRAADKTERDYLGRGPPVLCRGISMRGIMDGLG